MRLVVLLMLSSTLSKASSPLATGVSCGLKAITWDGSIYTCNDTAVAAVVPTYMLDLSTIIPAIQGETNTYTSSKTITSALKVGDTLTATYGIVAGTFTGVMQTAVPPGMVDLSTITTALSAKQASFIGISSSCSSGQYLDNGHLTNGVADGGVCTSVSAGSEGNTYTSSKTFTMAVKAGDTITETYGISAATGNFTTSLSAADSTVTGQETVSGSETVKGALIGETAIVQGVVAAGSMTVTGTTTLVSSVTITSSFENTNETVRGQETTTGSSTVQGALLAQSAILQQTVWIGSATIGGTVTMKSSVTILAASENTGSTIRGAETTTGSTTVQTALLAQSAILQQAVWIGSTTVGGTSTFKSSITVQVNSQINSLLYIGSATVSGTSTFQSSITVQGNGKIGSVLFVGSATISGTSTMFSSVTVSGSTVGASSMTVSGSFGYAVKLKATFDGMTGVVGAGYLCSDCANTYSLCVGSGTTLSGWKVAGSAATGCGTNN